MRKNFVVFTDGACSGNPGPGGWGAVILTPEDQVIEIGGEDKHTTNNKMEMTAVGKVLRHLEGKKGPIDFYVDSKYVINGMTQWIVSWQRQGWKKSDGKPIANIEYWKRLQELAAKRKGMGPIHWHYIPGHEGIPGNERCDEIAVSYSKEQWVDLFEGPLKDYSVDLLNIPEGAKGS